VSLRLVHRDRPVETVLEDDDHDRRVVPDRGLELLARHQHPAVADHGDDRTVGLGHLRGHRGGHRVAHRAVRRRELGARLGVTPVPVQEAGEVAGVVGHHRVAGGEPPQCAHHVRGVHAIRAGRGGRGPGLLDGRVRRGPVPGSCGGPAAQRREHRPRRRVDVQRGTGMRGRGQPRADQHQPLGRQRVAVVLGGHLVQSGPEHQDEVGALQGVQLVGRDPEAEVAGEVRVVLGERVLAPEGGVDAEPQRLGRDDQVGAGRAAPGDHDRTLGAVQLLGDPGCPVGDARLRGSRVRDRGGGAVVGGGPEVAGHREHRGTGAAAGGAAQCLGDEIRHLTGTGGLSGPLRDRREERGEVDLLEALPAQGGGVDLAEDDEHRRLVLERRVHADRRVGGARPAAGQHHRGRAVELAVGLGHERRAALVPRGDERRRGASLQLVEQAEEGLSRHGVRAFHPRSGKEIGNGPRNCPAHGSTSRSGRRRARDVVVDVATASARQERSDQHLGIWNTIHRDGARRYRRG
jgi:hypothetical protein